VILRRIHDAGFISKPVFAEAFDAELEQAARAREGQRPHFYLTSRCERAAVHTPRCWASTLEGAEPQLLRGR